MGLELWLWVASKSLGRRPLNSLYGWSMGSHIILQAGEGGHEAGEGGHEAGEGGHEAGPWKTFLLFLLGMRFWMVYQNASSVDIKGLCIISARR